MKEEEDEEGGTERGDASLSEEVKKSIKSAEMCSSLARRVSFSVASGHVTSFVVAAKTVNKVGGWITEPLLHNLNHPD